MNKPLAHLNVDLDEYHRRTEADRESGRKVVRQLILVAIFFFAAGVAALFFDALIVAGVLFLISLLFKDEATAARLETSMIATNWWLALLINKYTVDLETIKSDIKNESGSKP